MRSMIRYCCLFFLLVLLLACEQSDRTISFYYWKTGFQLGPVEREALRENAVTTLYVRYCDVDFKPGAAEPEVIAPLRFDTSMKTFRIVPVVFIKNRVFEKIDKNYATGALAENLFKLITEFNTANQLQAGMVQFDCDWTEGTKHAYFAFLQHYQKLSIQTVSVTIRLHQVKYPQRSGIPPVDHGVLMYYNMGKIDAGQGNSIYEKATAAKYYTFISDYPLELDAALPFFSWGLKIRNDRVVELLNKFYFAHFENDSNFNAVSSNRFVTKNACFKGGYYFAKDDVIKIENISPEQLLEMGDQLGDHSKKIKNIIFYDLDSSNLAQYEKDIFKKVLDRID